MSVRFRALLAVVSVALIGAAVPAISASAAGGTKTKVIVSLKLPAFHGKLKSSNACISHRTVKLYLVKGGPDKLLGTDKSEDNGSWSIPIGKKIPPGSYYATATPHGNCRGGKSKVLPVA